MMWSSRKFFASICSQAEQPDINNFPSFLSEWENLIQETSRKQ